MRVIIQCAYCGADKLLFPSLVKERNFCSRECQGKWRSANRSKENSPQWLDLPREKTCQQCGSVFQKKRNRGATHFQKAKFCSKACADVGGLRYSGPDNWNWNGNPRRTHTGGHSAWAAKVISRDKATCQHCGATGVELHAHHVKPYRDHPELRLDVDNGLTLCNRCHWNEHSTGSSANGVNSGEAAAGHAGGNPEPSFDGNVVEGVTTRGRAYRRWEGACEYCGIFISKRLSHVKGKAHHYCSKSCAWSGYWQRFRAARAVHGSNSSTSAPRESDDIVWPHVKA